jgi:hypothetical protein
MPVVAGLQENHRRIDDPAFGVDAQALGNRYRASSSDLSRICIDGRAREVALRSKLWRQHSIYSRASICRRNDKGPGASCPGSAVHWPPFRAIQL